MQARKKEQQAEQRRKKKQEEEERRKREEEEEGTRRSAASSSVPSSTPDLQRPGDRLLLGSRENSRSSIKVELLSGGQMGDEDKKELLESLVRQATSAEVSINRQKSKQAEQVPFTSCLLYHCCCWSVQCVVISSN